MAIRIIREDRGLCGIGVIGDSWPVWNRDIIPLFHTGHETPELPQIDFFLFRGGGFVRFQYFFSNRDDLRVSPDSDTISLLMFGGIGSIWRESHKNSLELAN